MGNTTPSPNRANNTASRCLNSKRTRDADTKQPHVIGNNYETWEALVTALRSAGLEKTNLLVAIDATKSNTWQGKDSFKNKNLHYPYSRMQVDLVSGASYDVQEGQYIEEYAPIIANQLFAQNTVQPPVQDSGQERIKVYNQYEYTIASLSRTINHFDDDGWIPTCIFGHQRNTGDPYVKQIYDHHKDQRGCCGLDGVLQAYRNAMATNALSGNTQFAPIVEWAINIVKQTMGHHILLIIGDGCIDDMEATKAKLLEACNVPLSIVFIGVGDGDTSNRNDKWANMRALDDNDNSEKPVDNWQSVYLTEMQEIFKYAKNADIELATWALMEVPDQYRYFKNHSLIRD